MLGMVNPTRMEFLRLRRRYSIAQRGHKLLKDKQDELMRAILDLIERIRELRLEVNQGLVRAISRFGMARAGMAPGEAEVALILPGLHTTAEFHDRRVMNVAVPVIEAKTTETGSGYGSLFTSGEFDLALKELTGVLQGLLKLAEMEKGLELLADELERTRRRVNALEFVVVPELEQTIKAIRFKLSEHERADLSRLMRVKEIVRR
jgi:V/A-type H+-transporting ATPase subunit D